MTTLDPTDGYVTLVNTFTVEPARADEPVDLLCGTAAYWVGVASRDHVRAGVAGGFAQLGHGKRAGLDRLAPGDRLVYYSPRERMGAGTPVRAFTAIGEVLDAPVRQGEMGGGFHPFRRDVGFYAAEDAPIAPLLPLLSFTKDRANWGLVFRRGAFRITADDYRLIANAMQARRAVPFET